jgi:hypothetical protein
MELMKIMKIDKRIILYLDNQMNEDEKLAFDAEIKSLNSQVS